MFDVVTFIKGLVDNGQRAVNWAGLANGAGLFVIAGVFVAWGFGFGDTAAIAVVAEPLKQLGFVFGGIGAIVVATNLGFDTLAGPLGFAAQKSKKEKEEQPLND